MARRTRKSSFVMPAAPQRRSTYAQRTGQDQRAAQILYKAANEKPVTHETVDGQMVRDWTPSEKKSMCNAKDVAAALQGHLAWDIEDLLENIPASGVKLALCQGWIAQTTGKPYFVVTQKGAYELALPKTSKFHGCAIAFAKNGKLPSFAQADKMVANAVAGISYYPEAE